MDKNTKNMIDQIRHQQGILTRVIAYWQANPLSQPSVALETHLGRLQKQVDYLEEEIVRCSKMS